MKPAFLAVLFLTAVFVAALPARAGEATRIRISRADCARLVAHRAAPDVAYRPGVDVRGRKVAPADVAGTPNLKDIVPDTIEFAIELNPLKGGAARFGETSLDVGQVKFNMATRRATLNGRPLSDAQSAELSLKCQGILRRRK